MDDLELKINRLIDRKLESMTNLTNPNHYHNGYDVNQIDPAVGLKGFPVVQVADATVAPTDTPPNGTFRFQVDTTPNYRMWVYTVYSSASSVLTGAWKATSLSDFGGVTAVSIASANGISGTSSGGATPALTIALGSPVQTGKTVTYNNISTAGWGVPAIYGSDRKTAQNAAVALATYTVGASDGSFLVSANVNVTTSTNHSFTIAVVYTDETNTSRSLTLPVIQVGGTYITAITNVTGAGPYEGTTVQIRAKAGTGITITTTGTFTTVTYNVEGSIIQVA